MIERETKPLVQAQLGLLLPTLGHYDQDSAMAWPHRSGGRHTSGSLGQNLHPPEARPLQGWGDAWCPHGPFWGSQQNQIRILLWVICVL